jgi:hypothetical protein
MSNPSILSFVEDIKNAGVTISNEQRFISLMSGAQDQDLMFSRVLKDRRHDIDFRGTVDVLIAPLSEAFKKQGFDGFAWKEFLQHMKID